MINGISWLVVTKLDVLDEMAEVPVCVGYQIDGKRPMRSGSGQRLREIECLYETEPGWKTSTQGITAMDKLPKQAREYLAFLEKESGARVGMVSTGPDRNHTMFVDEFTAAMKAAGRLQVEATA